MAPEGSALLDSLDKGSSVTAGADGKMPLNEVICRFLNDRQVCKWIQFHIPILNLGIFIRM